MINKKQLTTISWSDFAFEKVIQPFNGINFSKYIERYVLLGWEAEIDKQGIAEEKKREIIADLVMKNHQLSQEIEKNLSEIKKVGAELEKTKKQLDLVIRRTQYKVIT